MLLASLAHAADEVQPPVREQVDTALHSVLLVAGVLVVLILVAVAVMVFRRAFVPAPTGAAPAPPGLAPDPLAEAAAEERQGNFIAAAGRYEAAGDRLKAADCWEKVKDFARAAECSEAGGDLDRAAQLHLRSGGALRAAGIYMRTKNYIEAAKIFRNKGDHLRAAQALELFGNKVAAAREYSAGGNHGRAAWLLEGERMFAEAAEAYHPLLGNAEVTAANADRHSTYAALLALAGEKQRAIMAYRRVLIAVPEHLRALSGLQNLLPRDTGSASVAAILAGAPIPGSVDITPEDGADEYPDRAAPAAQPETTATAAASAAPSAVSLEQLVLEIEGDPAFEGGDPLKRVFTLRSMIQAGRMEPRYSMRLWVQVMRALAERHRANVVLGRLSPESIVIDMENNVRFEAPDGEASAYLSPEVQAGLPPDRQADIYSMGVILYELVCGSLEHFGKKRAGEQFSDIPVWLDELIGRCVEKNLTKRYQTTEEVSAALLKLKSATPE
jgi:tetratricopeptide (TPR) repeat protein